MENDPLFENFGEKGLNPKIPVLEELEPPRELYFHESPEKDYEYLQTKVESQLRLRRDRFAELLGDLGDPLKEPVRYPGYEQIKGIDREALIEWQLDIKRAMDMKRVEFENILRSIF